MIQERTLFRFYLCLIYIPLFYAISFPVTLRGTVVDKENSKPIPGATVSVGHTLNRTITDSLGRFSLEGDLTSAMPSIAPLSKISLAIPWDRRKRVMDFSKAPGISSIAIFNLKGACLFSADLRKLGQRVRIPAVAHGVFLVKAFFGDRTSCSWKWTPLETHGIFSLPVLSAQVLGKTVASGEIQILFKHDDYFPFERRFASSGENIIIAMSPDPASFVFDRTQMHSYHFTVSHEDSLSLEKTAFDEIYVPADFSLDSIPFGKVGLRFKGSKYYLLKECFDSLGRVTGNPLCEKVAMKVKFDKYDSTARFHSLKRLNLHAMSDDPSKMHEILCYGLFRDMGIYASRTAYAKMYVNGSFWGLFLSVEEIDGRFTKSRWPNFGDGNLFKEVWPNWNNFRYFEKALVTNDHAQDSANGKRMAEYSRVILTSTKDNFVKNISPFMDLDYWVRYIAVDRAIHNADGIMTWYYDLKSSWVGNHNYYFYQEENTGGKIWLIPWDLPATLTKTDPIMDDNDMPEWNVAPDTCAPQHIWGTDYGYPPHCDPLIGLSAETCWERFVKAGEQFLVTCFNADRMKQKVDEYKTLIEPVVAQDPALDLEKWQNEVGDLRQTMDVLHSGFDDYLHNKKPALDTTGFSASFPDSGFLQADRVNNFEFSPISSLSLWSTCTASSGSTISLALDTINPLWGKSDLKCQFVFTPMDSAPIYSEGGNLNIFFKNETNLKSFKRIRMHLKCDATRNTFVYLTSKFYEQKGAKNSYGWNIYINAANKQYIFDMAQINYPSWGDPANPDILDSVLTTATGIGLNFGARYNNIGKLTAPDTGYLRIDNIIFEQ
jgi:hypothetical protein